MAVRGAFLVAVLAVLGTAMAVGFPASQKAPADRGLCWTMTSKASNLAAFAPLDRDIENAETCGARLEAVRLMRGGEVSGAFGGLYLWADDQGISAGSSLDGPRRELLSPKDRARVDDAIHQLIRRRAAEEGVSVQVAT